MPAYVQLRAQPIESSEFTNQYLFIFFNEIFFTQPKFEEQKMKIDCKPWHLLSRVAACDSLIYSDNFSGQGSDIQGRTLPLFEE